MDPGLLRAEFSQHGADMHLSAGALLWQEGDAGEYAVLLVEGRLEVIQQTTEGDVVILATLPAGSLLGEMSCMDGCGHSATVRAATVCHLRRLSAAAFRSFARSSPQVMEALFMEQTRRVRTLSRQVTTLAFENVVQRVAQYLLSHQTERVTLTHQELAERVAATRESVTKALGLLARRGCVALSRGSIRVLDRAGLEAESPT